MENVARILSAGVTLFLLLTGSSAFATDYSSTNFTVKDPVIVPGSRFATSSGFQLWSVVGEPAIGLSSAATFTLKGGFLYFPAPAAATSTPVVPPAAPYRFYGGVVTPAYPPPRPVSGTCDFNDDGECGIADLSILLFYYGRSGPAIARYDLSKNNIVDFPDISILFYYWTSLV